MDDFDNISEEEQKLAAELARHLDRPVDPGGAPAHTDSFAELASQVVLLENRERFELSAEARRRGRAEVDAWAKKPNRTTTPRTSAQRRWFYWLTVPAVVVAALALGIRREATEHPSAAPTASTPTLKQSETEAEADFEKLAPRFHAGETPRALLQAQAAVLAQRAPGREKDEARDEFDRHMRAYRGQLIASLEVGGR